MSPRPVRPLAETFQRLLWLLAVGAALVTFVELATLRHWQELIQASALLPIATAAIGLAIVRPTGRPDHLRAARLLLGVSLLMAAVGVGFHVWANLEAGPLDAQHGARWDELGTAARLWLASTGGVGPSPSLAPLALANVGALGLLSTLGRTPGGPAPAAGTHMEGTSVPAGR